MDIWSKKNRNTRQCGIICKKKNPCTPEKAEMKQIIEKESNLLNKIF